MSVKAPFRTAIALSLLIASAPACGNAEHDSLDPQGDVAGPVDDGVGESRATLPLPWVSGKATCAYGTFGCNKCVPDVPAAFNRASGSRSRRHRFFFDPNEFSENEDNPDHFAVLKDHIQSITRIPGLGEENFIALSRNARDKGDGAFYITFFPQISSHGDAWKWAFRRTTSNPTAKQYAYYRMPVANHAGGMQAVGPMLFVASDCDEGNSCTAAVHIYDVRNPGSTTRPISSIVLDGSQGELDFPPATTIPQPWGPSPSGASGSVSSRAAAVGAVRLKDGRMLVFIRGREFDYNGWFFVSDSEGIGPQTHWTFVDHWTTDDLKRDPWPGDPWRPWENVNLISDCNDGQIYAVAMGMLSNKSFLYRITSSDLGGRENLFFEYVAGRGLNTTGPATSTRYGAGVHVTPNGNLVSYVTDRRPEFEIEEFRYHGAHGD